MERGIGMLLERMAFPQLEAWLRSRRFRRRQRRPEPFRPLDRWERAAQRRRRRAWIAVGLGGLVAVGVLAVVQDSAPRRPPAAQGLILAAETRPAPLPLVAAAPATLAEPAGTMPANAVPVLAEPATAAPPEAPPAPREVTVTGNPGTNLRAAPARTGTLLWTAPRGTRLRAAEAQGDWLRVTSLDGRHAGWMHRDFLAE
jgi:hypothetical protein